MYTFKVEGMHCGSCADGMEDALKRLDPQGEIAVDIEQQTVAIRSSRPEAELTALIADAGYSVVEVVDR